MAYRGIIKNITRDMYLSNEHKGVPMYHPDKDMALVFYDEAEAEAIRIALDDNYSDAHTLLIWEGPNWDRYHIIVSVYGTQEATFSDDDIDWGSVEVNSYSMIHIYDEQNNSHFVGEIHVDGTDDKEIVEMAAEMIAEYEKKLEETKNVTTNNSGALA